MSDWTEPADRPLAKKVYDFCCSSGGGECCRALVEQKLTMSPTEEARDRIRATALGSPVRTPEELAAKESRMQASIDKGEESLSAERTQEAAHAARDQQAILGMSQQLAQSVDQAAAQLAHGNNSNPGTNPPVAPRAVQTPSATTTSTTPSKPQHCRNPNKDSRAGNGDLVCITTDVGHPCVQDNECDSARCTIPGTAFLFDPGESGNGVCCAQAGRSCDKKHPCCLEAHCVATANIGQPDEQGMCNAN